MSRYLLFFLLVTFLTVGAIYLKSQYGGALPVVLPPIQPKQPQPIKNDLGLNLPPGFAIETFAENLGNARDLEISPDGTVLVSVPSQGKILALPDKNNDGQSDDTIEVLSNLNKPHGLAFYNGKLFIAEETKVTRYTWNPTTFSATFDKHLLNLQKGGRHFTRTIAFDNSGQMFVSIGSTCDVCFEKHPHLAAVIVSDANGTNPRLFAKGLRNSVFITVNPATQELWGTEMGRDFLGDNLPPDEINIIKQDKDYGWPLCYGNRVHDTDFDKKFYPTVIPQPPCAETEPPLYEICAHCAPLGLTFVDSPQFPKDWQQDLLVAYHGSWNSSTPVGYKVVKIEVQGEKILREDDFISGFQKGNQTIARPVDLIFDKNGNLYISDDKAGVIYKVTHRD